MELDRAAGRQASVSFQLQSSYSHYRGLSAIETIAIVHFPRFLKLGRWVVDLTEEELYQA